VAPVSPILIAILPSILLGTYLALIAVQPARDPDSWWLAATGDWMLEAGAVPRWNLFSFADGDVPWVMHEWLLAPLYAKGSELLGPAFFTLLATAYAALALVAVTAGLKRDAVDTRSMLAVMAIFLVGLGCFFFLARPSSLSLVLIGFCAWIAYAPRFGALHQIAAVALTWLWANAHGSFPLSVALLGAGALDANADRRRRWAACAVAAAITLANPYGLGLHELVFEYVHGRAPIHAWIHSHIREFAPPWHRPYFGPPWAWPANAAAVVLAVRAVVTGRRRAAGLLVVLISACGLLSARHLPVATMIACALLAGLVSSGGGAPSVGTRRELAIWVPAFSTAAGACAFLYAFVAKPSEHWLEPASRSLVQLMPSFPDGANVFAPASQSGEVLWRGASRGIRVLYDYRNDCYRPETGDAQFALAGRKVSTARFREIVARYGVDTMFIDNSSALAERLANEPSWHRRAQHGGWSLWLRQSSGGNSF
jgi:hypothetical protein